MRRLATLPARRLWAIAAAVLLVAAGGGIAQAALSGSAKPAPKPLNAAVRDALNAPAVPGITARIRFTNHLLPSGSTGGRGGTTPLIAGATGRLWLAQDGRARIELQSDNGDAQIVSDGKTLTVYDATSNTVYKAALPADTAKQDGAGHGPATLADVNRGLAKLAQSWRVSGAQPSTTAGQPSYTVKVTPKDDGGLLGAAQVAWDAARGVPLRAAIYAQGQSSPVLELTATGISYGKVAAAALRATPPAGAKVVEVKPPAHAAAPGGAKSPKVSGAGRVAAQLDFPLAAPAKLAGLPRKDVRLLSLEGSDGAISTYGRGLGAIVVVERKADPAAKGPSGGPVRDLPKINIGGATGTELSTALGTVVTFDRAGVSYTVAGSVPPVAAENAARGLR